MRACALVAAGGIALVLVACGSSGPSTSAALTGGVFAPATSGGDYCAAARAVRDAQAEISALDTATAVAVEKSALADLVGKVDAAASAAPPDISADWATVRGYFDIVNTAVQSASDTAQVSSNVAALQTDSAATAASASLDAAGRHIDVYTGSHCGFTIATPAPGAASTGSESSSSFESST